MKVYPNIQTHCRKGVVSVLPSRLRHSSRQDAVTSQRKNYSRGRTELWPGSGDDGPEAKPEIDHHNRGHQYQWRKTEKREKVRRSLIIGPFSPFEIHQFCGSKSVNCEQARWAAR